MVCRGHVYHMQRDLDEVASLYLKEDQSPSFVERIFNTIQNVFRGPVQDLDLQKARKIKKLVQETESLETEPASIVLLLLICTNFHSQSNRFRNKLIKNTKTTIGCLEQQHNPRDGFFALLLNRNEPYGNSISFLEKKFLPANIDYHAIDRFLKAHSNESGLSFVAIWHLRKHSTPACLPKDIVKIIYHKSREPLLDQFYRSFAKPNSKVKLLCG